MKSSSLWSCRASNKAFQMGLCYVWVFGFLLIIVSLYLTQSLPSLTDQIKSSRIHFKVSHVSSSLRITIFSTTEPFVGLDGLRQVLAIRSWLALSAKVNVVLFTQDSSLNSLATQLSPRVSFESDIDFTFLGTPFFHSMVARAQASESDVSVLIDPGTILLPDFLSTLNYAYELNQDWLLFASLRNVSHFPYYLDESGKQWLKEDGKRISMKKEFLAQSWEANSICGGRMLMAWNKGDMPLHGGVLPPFLYRKGLHNHWIVGEAFSSGYRFVFDATWAFANIYPNILNADSSLEVEGAKVPYIQNRIWENVGNQHLASLYGSSDLREANFSNIVKLLYCDGRHIFVGTEELVHHSVGPRSSLKLLKARILRCMNDVKSQEAIMDCSLEDSLKPSATLGLPFSLETLLSKMADENKTVVLAVAGYNYKDMLMSWVCGLKRLMVRNFLVCALDDNIYKFSVLQGLPVFRDPLAPSNISFDDCHFGTMCFQRVTKVKSRLVLQILKLGYNVLLSDVDVFWFKNPLPLLQSFGPAVLVAQSDEFNETVPINLPHRLNSGFYFACSDGSTIAAMEKVVKHATTSNRSEQPSFYNTLCGEGGLNRVGNDRCFEPETNLSVHFLNRDLFPNGAYLGLWESKDIKAACRKRGCYVLHNNWISGRKKKLARQVLSGLWNYEQSTRILTESRLVAMLRRFAQLLGLLHHADRGARRKVDVREVSKSLTWGLGSQNFQVRIVHPGGREELYQNAVPASLVMEKYPGKCVAKPDVFKDPHESILQPEDDLLPGHKYYLIPASTVAKLKCRHSERLKAIEQAKDKEEMSITKVDSDVSDISLDSIGSARDFFVSKEKWSTLLGKCKRVKKPFVPPIQRAQSWRQLEWQPSLNSVQELSP
ncbi:PADRE domain [Dillenia turbinata]|uniref:PADRE domain n=1 Tax=Dillenia turbinata TaxID=194707 RepID=A0AAN8ZAF8_9MAGN